VNDHAVIEAERIAKSFVEVQALAGVDLSVDEGAIVGLLGPNGAGKTTLVRILTTLLKPDAGRARVAGHDVCAEQRAVRSVIGLAGQAAAVDGLLTGRENVEMIGRLYGLSRREARERAATVLEMLGIADAADRLVRGYSGGMRRRLDLGASLVGRPRILILDEPTTGLDPRTRLDLWELVAGLARDGNTVLLTTQYLEEADRLAGRIFVVDRGRVIAEGTPDELKRRCGADVIDIRLHDGRAGEAGVEALAPLATNSPHWDADSQRLSLRSKDGAATLLDALRRLDGAGVELEDIALRRPSLDDVFLSITGHAATSEDDERAAPGRGSKRRAP
jgi:ABC-2 type transport system ATP-binding protein